MSRWVSQEAFDAYVAVAAEDVRTGEWRGDSANDRTVLSFEVVQRIEQEPWRSSIIPHPLGT